MVGTRDHSGVTPTSSLCPPLLTLPSLPPSNVKQVGGRKLIGILNNDKVLTPLIRWTCNNFICAVPLFIASNGIQLAIYAGIRATGERNLYGMSASYSLIGHMIAYLAWIALRFIHNSNRTRIDKSRGKIAPGTSNTATAYGNTTASNTTEN